MSLDATARVQEEAMKAMSELDKKYLRKMQAEMHRCAANCCDDAEVPPENVQHCVENCGLKLRAAQNLIRQEFDNFRDRLERCYVACGDTLKDKMSAIPSDLEIDKYRGELEICGKKCAETHISLISNILKRLKELLNKREFETNFS